MTNQAAVAAAAMADGTAAALVATNFQEAANGQAAM